MQGAFQEKVSICLLTYKRAEVLHRSLDSLLAQSYRNFELIINDDCSPDGTAAVCAEYAAKDSRIRYCRNEPNLRYAGNQNAALVRATCDLVAIVHDGDVYRSDCVEKWAAALSKNPTVGLVFNASDGLDQAGNVVQEHRHSYAAVTAGKTMIDEMLRLYNSPIFGIVMLRKSVMSNAGEFDMRYPILADVDMWFRVLMLSDAAYIDEPLYQIHPRESDHINSDVNWKVLLEHYRIFSSNAARRHPNADEQKRALRLIRAKFRMTVFRSCLWALKRGRYRLALNGVKYFTAK